MSNVILWDIETTGFTADWDQILCIGWKKLDGKKVSCPSVHKQKDWTDDKPVLEAIYPVLADADMWITHNGRAFDVPFVNARLLYHGMDPLPRQMPHVDTYWNIARGGVKVSSRRLGALADFFQLEEQKGGCSRHCWRQAKRGCRKSMKEIADYCKQDIRTMEAVYEKMRPLCLTHPNLPLLGKNSRPACPICSESGQMQKRGKLVKRSTVWQRYQCQACGGWSSAPDTKKGKIR